MEQELLDKLEQFSVKLTEHDESLRCIFWSMESVKNAIFDTDTPRDLIRMGYHLSDLNNLIFDCKEDFRKTLKILDDILEKEYASEKERSS